MRQVEWELTIVLIWRLVIEASGMGVDYSTDMGGECSSNPTCLLSVPPSSFLEQTLHSTHAGQLLININTLHATII